MRIVFVIGGLGVGGQERALSTLANSLADRGYRVKIVCLFLTPVAFPLRECIEVVWPEIDRRKMGKILYALRIVRYLRRAISGATRNQARIRGCYYRCQRTKNETLSGQGPDR